MEGNNMKEPDKQRKTLFLVGIVTAVGVITAIAFIASRVKEPADSQEAIQKWVIVLLLL
ncbi:MAG: hypothetical protein ACYTE8_04425 [Planctomycetota bacterium]